MTLLSRARLIDWMLRSYLPKGHPLKARELGSEKTPGEFVARMVEVFRLVRDCMAPHATCWLNMGDSYSAGSRVGHGTRINHKQQTNAGTLGFEERPNPGFDSGNLCLIPQRLAIALQDDGWLVRSIVVWHKPAPMPASVAGWRWMRCRMKVKESNSEGTGAQWGQRNGVHKHRVPEWSDCPGCAKCRPNGGLVLRRGSWRPTSSWEPILMLAKKPGYYADGEAVRTAAKSATVSRDKYTRIAGEESKCFIADDDTGGAAVRLGREDRDGPQFAVRHDHETSSAAGANLRDVWTIAAEPLSEKHYAAFPTELVRLCLKAGTSERGYCRECGKPWARVVESDSQQEQENWSGAARGNGCMVGGGHEGRTGQWSASAQTLGWRPTCTCPDAGEPRPALVLDPFAGSGRTGVTAQRMFLDFVGVELNPDYAEMSERILRDDCPLFST